MLLSRLSIIRAVCYVLEFSACVRESDWAKSNLTEVWLAYVVMVIFLHNILRILTKINYILAICDIVILSYKNDINTFTSYDIIKKLSFRK